MRVPWAKAFVVAAALLISCAACSAATRTSSAAASPGPAGTVTATGQPALPSPGCTTATSKSAALTSVRTVLLKLPGNPFGVAATPDGRWAFVATGGAVEVLRAAGPLSLKLVRAIPVPAGTPGPAAGLALGEAITPDGRYLLAAAGDGAVVISVARAERGASGAVLGTLHAPGGAGAIEVAVSRDGRYAFVSEEDTQRAAVFNLAEALASGFGARDYVGAIPLGLAPVGLAVSPDGRWLYATSEVRAPAAPAGDSPGTLTVISLRRAETTPAASVVATVNAGCQPVRVTTSADGSEVWVTARASDDLLCFSAARLRSAPARALIAAVRVGEAPVGLAAVQGGRLIIVADSNRFGVSGASSDLDVVSVAAALRGRPAVIGHIRAGLFPRDMTLAPDGALLVSDYASGQLEAVDVASIPGR